VNLGQPSKWQHSDVEQARAVMFIEFFAFLERHDIRYAILAGYEEYPAHIASDVDFMVAKEDFDRLPSLLQRADCVPGATMVQVLRHQATARYFVFAKQIGAGLAYLHPDATCDYRLKSRLWLRSERVLASRRKSPLGFWIPAAAIEFEYYLIKRVVDKALCERQQLTQLRRAWAEDADGCKAVLGRLLPADMVEATAAAILAGDAAWFRREMRTLRTCLTGAPPLEPAWNRLTALAAEAGRWVSRLLRPTGLVLAVLGPDGSGKGTILDDIERELGPAFRRAMRMHIRPRFGHARHAGPSSDPHGVVPRGWVSGALKIAWVVAEFLWGWLCLVWPAKIRSTLILFDRYYDDMLVDPTRYRLDGRFNLARQFAPLIPRPDLWLVLTAPPEVLLARKREVTLEAARELVSKYEAMASRLRGAVLINTAEPIDQVLAQSIGVVVRFLEGRVAKRSSHKS
jgi:thymidylate kinase